MNDAPQVSSKSVNGLDITFLIRYKSVKKNMHRFKKNSTDCE